MESLLPESLEEHKEVGRLDSTFSNYSSIDASTLLISGGKSPKSVRDTVVTLTQTIPRTKVLVLPKLTHLAPDNRNAPAKVARHVKQYFLN